MKKLGIILPWYKESYTPHELRSVVQLNQVIGDRYDKIIISPDTLSEDFFYQPLFSGYTIKKYKPEYFTSPYSYSALLESPFFWSGFLDQYEYVLIYQGDCWIFDASRLEDFCKYDYVGAPFLVYRYKETVYRDLVGNGGFSIRKVSAMHEVTKKYGPQMIHFDDLRTPGVGLDCIPEDMYFSLFHKDELSICPPEIAVQFSIEYYPEIFLERLAGDLPVGVHKVWDHYDVWKKYIEKSGA